MPSFKATDGRRTLLQGPGLRHIFGDWLKRYVAVCNVIDELDRIIFEEEESTVTL